MQVFLYVNDWLKDNQKRLKLPKQPAQVASYSELFTTALVGEMQAQQKGLICISPCTNQRTTLT